MQSKGILTPIQEAIMAAGKEITGVNVYKVWNVFAVINDIAGNVANLPYTHFERKANDDPVEMSNKISQLYLNRPNPLDSPVMFKRRINSYLMLNGNAYIWVPGLFNPTEFIVLPSQNVEPKQSQDGLMSHYEWQKKDGSKIDIPIDEMIHIRTFNPDNPVKGMSALDAARSIIKLQESSIKWNQSIMDNRGQPEGAWVAEMETKEQLDVLKESVAEAVNDYDNKGLPLVLGGGLDFKRFSLTPQEVDWILSDKMSLRKICFVLGYPSQLAGDTDAQTYSNIREMERRLFTDTIIPYGQQMNSSFNHFFYPDGLHYFGINKKQIEQIQTTIEERANTVKGLPVIRIDDVLKTLGFEPVGADKGGDTVLISNAYMPMDQMTGDIGLPPKGEE
jgi:HK97 family phage portal protein